MGSNLRWMGSRPPSPLTLFLLKWYTATMLARSSTMHRPWKDATASRRAPSSCTVHGVSSRQKGQPSRHGRHLLARSEASSLPGPCSLPGDITEGYDSEGDETPPAAMMSSARGDAGRRLSRLPTTGCVRCVGRGGISICLLPISVAGVLLLFHCFSGLLGNSAHRGGTGGAGTVATCNPF